jgi:hypothetical protein
MGNKKIWYFGAAENVQRLGQERSVISNARIGWGGVQSHFLGVKFDIIEPSFNSPMEYFLADKNHVISLMDSLGVASHTDDDYLENVPKLNGKVVTLYRNGLSSYAGFSAGCKLEAAVETV